jgi:hypothetical protein
MTVRLEIQEYPKDRMIGNPGIHERPHDWKSEIVKNSTISEARIIDTIKI